VTPPWQTEAKSATVGKDDELVPLGEAEVLEAESEASDLLAELLGRDGRVDAALLDQHEIRLGVGLDRVQKHLGKGGDHSSLQRRGVDCQSGLILKIWRGLVKRFE